MQSEAGNNEEWDDSILKKEEVDARLQRKVEAMIKRERAMAFAYSHQVLTNTALTFHTCFTFYTTKFIIKEKKETSYILVSFPPFELEHEHVFYALFLLHSFKLHI